MVIHRNLCRCFDRCRTSQTSRTGRTGRTPTKVTMKALRGRFSARSSHAERAALLIELLVAIALLVGAVLPLAYSIASEERYARGLYQRAVAMEIVDGELEALAAGEWRAFTNGVSEYSVHAAAAANLPPGRFVLTRQENHLRLEWRPGVKHHGGAVVREVTVK